MKLLLLALVAVASAEPDSYNWPYTTYNAGLYSAGVAGVPTIYNGWNAWNNYLPSTYSNLYSSSLYGHGLIKRDADADPYWYAANPWAYSAGVYQPSWYSGYRAGIPATVSEPVLKQGNFHTNLRNALKGVHTAPVGQVYQSTFNTVVKRDAESDADSLWPYYNYNTAGVYNYNTAVAGVPSVYNGLFNYQYQYPSVYGGLYANRLIKRDADADSDAFLPTVSNAGFYNYYQYPSTLYNSALVNSAVVNPAVVNPAVRTYIPGVYNGLRYW